MHAGQKLEKRWADKKFLCIGLDPEIKKLPIHLQSSVKENIVRFNTEIVDATHDLVCAFKPNSAFYEAYGAEGIQALKETCDYITANHPDILLLLDAKRGDIGSTNNGYVAYAFDYLQADSITVQPYLGEEALLPFLERKEKLVFVLAKTSNPGAGEFQDLVFSGEKLYEVVAKQVTKTWNKNNNCGLVVGATYPDELAGVRKEVFDMPILIPGIGAQGGDLQASVAAGRNSKNQGILMSSSRGIIYASNSSDFALAARGVAEKLDQQIKEIIRV